MSEFPRQLSLVLDEKNKLQEHLSELQAEFLQMSHVLDDNAKLQRDSVSLQNQLETLNIELGQERERSLCNICFDKPRDTLVFSCLHLHFCSACLQKHQERTNTCPTCRSFISGKLICNLSISWNDWADRKNRRQGPDCAGHVRIFNWLLPIAGSIADGCVTLQLSNWLHRFVKLVVHFLKAEKHVVSRIRSHAGNLKLFSQTNKFWEEYRQLVNTGA